jgi:hypothetical protein
MPASLHVTTRRFIMNIKLYCMQLCKRHIVLLTFACSSRHFAALTSSGQSLNLFAVVLYCVWCASLVRSTNRFCTVIRVLAQSSEAAERSALMGPIYLSSIVGSPASPARVLPSITHSTQSSTNVSIQASNTAGYINPKWQVGHCTRKGLRLPKNCARERSPPGLEVGSRSPRRQT